MRESQSIWCYNVDFVKRNNVCSKTGMLSSEMMLKISSLSNSISLMRKEVQKKIRASCLISLRGCLFGREQKSFIYKRSIQEEDGDDKDTFDMWDITAEDVERIRQFLTPNLPKVIEYVIQPLILKTLHTTPPNEGYVALATRPILDDILEEFGNKILNVTIVDEEADFNPTMDIEELEKLLAKDPQSHYTKIQVLVEIEQNS
nr:hypothetical protein [Tanacetum cinerariifolium]